MQMTIGLAALLPFWSAIARMGSARRNQSVRVAVTSVILLSGIFYALAGWPKGFPEVTEMKPVLERWKMALSLSARSSFHFTASHYSGRAAAEESHPLSVGCGGDFPDYSQGWWLTKALKEALSRNPVGEVRVRGAGEK